MPLTPSIPATSSNQSIPLVLLLLLMLCTVFQSAYSEPNERLVIGAALPLTGPIAWVGQAMQRGIQMAADEANRDPGAKKIDVKFQDDLSSNRTTAVTIYKDFTGNTQVDAAINCSTSTLSAIAPVITQSKTPTVILWDSNRDMPKLSPYAIGFGYSNEQAAEESAEFLVSTKGRKKIAVINYTNDWSELLTRSFLAKARALGATITLAEQVDGTTTDFRSLLARARQSGSDGLYFPLYGAGLTTAIRQAKDLKFSGTILTVDSLGDEELRDCGPAAEGIFVSQIYLQDQTFLTRLRDRFPESTESLVSTGYSALAYDGATFLFKTLRTAARPQLIERLKGVTIPGVLGTTRLSPDGIADRSIPILEIRGGRFLPLS